MTKPKTPPPVFRHGRCVLAKRPDGSVDVCDPATHVWANFPTQRAAKWSASVFTNMAERFGHNPADADTALDAYIQAQTRAYPELT